jgi:hypothetical protein
MENLSKDEIFGNLILKGLESGYINSINFPDKFLPDINSIKEKLIKYSDDFMLGYELNEIIQYSDENNFFERYLFSDDGDKLILINLNWFFEYGKKLFNQSQDYEPDELSEFFLNAIYYSYLKNKKLDRTKISLSSYQWQTNPDKELPELYSLMISKYKLIASETTLEQFIAAFTGQSIESITPIKWHQENASELLYFIMKLGQSNNIEYNPKKADYQKMTACFVKPDGNQFQAIWKSLKTDIKINLSLDKQKAIDDLINNF